MRPPPTTVLCRVGIRKVPIRGVDKVCMGRLQEFRNISRRSQRTQLLRRGKNIQCGAEDKVAAKKSNLCRALMKDLKSFPVVGVSEFRDWRETQSV